MLRRIPNDVSCQETLVRDGRKPAFPGPPGCDKLGSKLNENRLRKDERKICKEEKVQVFSTKAQADSVQVSIDKKEVKFSEEEESKQDKHNLTKIPEVFEGEIKEVCNN